jgi:predicted Zn-dependent protease
MKRIEVEMPDEGGFADIFELFCNPDVGTSDIVGKYGLHVFKMRADIVPDPAKRYVQACAYIPSAEYKATLMAGSGTKVEILTLMNEPAYAEKLNYTFGELLDMLQDF